MSSTKEGENLVTVVTPGGSFVLVGDNKIICPSVCEGEHALELHDRSNGNSEVVCRSTWAPKRFKNGQPDEGDLRRNFLEDCRRCIHWDAAVKSHSPK